MHEFYEEEVKETLGKLNRLLADLPAPGGGFNPALLPVAHAAFMAGCSCEEFVMLVRTNIRSGSRAVNDAEIRRAFERVASNPGSGSGEAKVKIVVDAIRRQQVIDAGREAGPWWSGYQSLPAGEQTARQLEAMFMPLDRVWIGTAERTQPIYGQILPSMEWARRARLGMLPKYWVHLIVNPLTGAMGKTKEGKESNRCDDCVTRTDHVLIEFDRPEIPLEMQLEFWAGIEEPRLRALTYSGGKSIHAICYVGDLAWPDAVDLMRDRIYGPLGADPKVFTKSRLARLAGSVRNNVPQHLLWSAPCR